MRRTNTLKSVYYKVSVECLRECVFVSLAPQRVPVYLYNCCSIIYIRWRCLLAEWVYIALCSRAAHVSTQLITTRNYTSKRRRSRNVLSYFGGSALRAGTRTNKAGRGAGTAQLSDAYCWCLRTRVLMRPLAACMCVCVMLLLRWTTKVCSRPVAPNVAADVRVALRIVCIMCADIFVECLRVLCGRLCVPYQSRVTSVTRRNIHTYLQHTKNVSHCQQLRFWKQNQKHKSRQRFFVVEFGACMWWRTVIPYY